MSLIANESYPHLSPTLPHLVITPAPTCHYASTYLPLHPTQLVTTPAPTCHYTQPKLSLFQHLPVTTLNSTCYYASTYLSLHKHLSVTTQAQTCKHLSHPLFPTHAFQAPRTCLSTYENMPFLPIEHALLVP